MRERKKEGVGSPSSLLHQRSQPSSHNYYHHLDLTLSTLVLCVYRTKIVLVFAGVHIIVYDGGQSLFGRTN